MKSNVTSKGFWWLLFWALAIPIALSVAVSQIQTAPHAPQADSAKVDSPAATPYPTDYPPEWQTQEAEQRAYDAMLDLTPDGWEYMEPFVLFPPTSDPRAANVFIQPEGTPFAGGLLVPRYGAGGPMRILNAWFNDKYSVYAGGTRDTRQGWVWIHRAGEDGSDIVNTPTEDGWLTIVDIQGERVILQSGNGNTYYFDMPGMRFVDSLTEFVPTATLLPTWTPGPTDTPVILSDDAASLVEEVHLNKPQTSDGKSPINVDLQYYIDASFDKDWFVFHNDATGTIRVDLTNLVANYDLYLFHPSDKAYWRSSKNQDTTFEQIVLDDAPPSDYYVMVIGADGAFDSSTPYTLRFEVDRTPPTLALSAAPSELWPPNHKLVTVQVTVQATDDLDPNPVVQLVSVTSSEPDDGLGDGDKPGDIVINPDGTIQLRAERSGNGNGRIYTITYSAADRAGNVTTQSVTVSVPHNR